MSTYPGVLEKKHITTYYVLLCFPFDFFILSKLNYTNIASNKMLSVGSGNGFCLCDKYTFHTRGIKPILVPRILPFTKGFFQIMVKSCIIQLKTERLNGSYARNICEGMVFVLATSGNLFVKSTDIFPNDITNLMKI